VGEALLALGRPGDAVEPLEASLALRLASQGDLAARGATQALLARALWAARRQRSRALRLADEALPRLSEAERGELTAELRGWRSTR
jgi:hypothetical protein